MGIFQFLKKILIVTTSFVELHLFTSVLNLWLYAARESFSYCWISMKCEVYALILALQSLSHIKYFISSQDLSEVIASVTNIWFNPLDLAFASLAQLLFVRSATVSISISKSSNFVESYSLKIVMSCSNKLVRFVCICVVHEVSKY